MFGTFQQSNLRIEVEATADQIRDSLTVPDSLKKWLWPQQFSEGLDQPLAQDQTFSSSLGPISLSHQVESLTSNSIRFILHGGIDGFHEWCWGDGWVQSRIEGVTLLPLNLAQTTSLLRLRLFLAGQSEAQS